MNMNFNPLYADCQARLTALFSGVRADAPEAATVVAPVVALVQDLLDTTSRSYRDRSHRYFTQTTLFRRLKYLEDALQSDRYQRSNHALLQGRYLDLLAVQVYDETQPFVAKLCTRVAASPYAFLLEPPYPRCMPPVANACPALLRPPAPPATVAATATAKRTADASDDPPPTPTAKRICKTVPDTNDDDDDGGGGGWNNANNAFPDTHGVSRYPSWFSSVSSSVSSTSGFDIFPGLDARGPDEPQGTPASSALPPEAAPYASAQTDVHADTVGATSQTAAADAAETSPESSSITTGTQHAAPWGQEAARYPGTAPGTAAASRPRRGRGRGRGRPRGRRAVPESVASPGTAATYVPVPPHDPQDATTAAGTAPDALVNAYASLREAQLTQFHRAAMAGTKADMVEQRRATRMLQQIALEQTETLLKLSAMA
ncbi:hypothetical protein SPI_05531 [Niveomyces insectorum RCEF 264]|uniref:Uncharacterized protein n=1 Tax=Niveomyces insectorum RCEF 264 TaxID=1081102 RepID=A0A167TB24_9HYPO|nr:hypothetical protein SPI_05531 [Niveomyces insectorum RCEF 264]